MKALKEDNGAAQYAQLHEIGSLCIRRASEELRTEQASAPPNLLSREGGTWVKGEGWGQGIYSSATQGDE